MYGETLEEMSQNARTMLALINSYQQEYGYAPSVRDLRDALKLSSVSHVSYIRNRLALAGLVTFSFRVARSTQLTPKGHAILRAALAQMKKGSDNG